MAYGRPIEAGSGQAGPAGATVHPKTDTPGAPDQPMSPAAMLPELTHVTVVAGVPG